MFYIFHFTSSCSLFLFRRAFYFLLFCYLALFFSSSQFYHPPIATTMNINERVDHSANELTSLCPSYSPHGTGGNADADADADPIQIMRSNTFTTTAGSPTFVWRHFVFGASACLLLLGIGTYIHIDSKHVFAGLKQDFKISNNDKNLLGGFGGDAIISENEEIQVHISPFHLLQKSQCFQDKKYSSHTAKTAYELPFAAMFKDTKDEKKFEASSLIKVCSTTCLFVSFF